MIRWEEQADGNWLGYSGQSVVATVTKADENRWDWDVPGAGKPKGWRNSGHRTNELDAPALPMRTGTSGSPRLP